MVTIWSLLAALALALAHIAGGAARPPSARARSFAGGVGVGYVFVVVLPKLSMWQQGASDEFGAERLFFIVAMIGLAAYYLLEVGVKRLGKRESRRPAAWLHIGGFAFYSAIGGFVVASYGDREAVWIMAYAAAMGLHFYMNDISELNSRGYPAFARWILAGAVMAGWAAGLVASHRYEIAALLFAMLAGGMILNILQEELPGEKDGLPVPFLVGIAVMVAISFLIPL